MDIRSFLEGLGDPFLTLRKGGDQVVILRDVLVILEHDDRSGIWLLVTVDVSGGTIKFIRAHAGVLLCLDLRLHLVSTCPFIQ